MAGAFLEVASMRMAVRTLVALAVVTGAVSTTARADVFNMPPGYTSLQFVSVGDAGNPADTRFATPGYGSVAYPYRIGTFEITAGQYCQYLNAVARTSIPYDWNDKMSSANGPMIRRTGTAGSYSYTVDANGDGIEDMDWVNRPVNWVSWTAAARFCNWLHNGQPNTGVQDLTTTEDGAYYLPGPDGNYDALAITRKADAKFWIPSEDEWYKAAYYDPAKPGGVGYWTYPTRSDDPPSSTLIDPDPGNSANYNYAGGMYNRTEVGAFENSGGPFGTFDQGGNVREWTETRINLVRVVRGGAYLDSTPTGLTPSPSGGYAPNEWRQSTGFRVAAAVPEPSVVAMMTVAAFLAAAGAAIRSSHRPARHGGCLRQRFSRSISHGFLLSRKSHL
jgi:formylglycine-generating enzyme